MPRYTVKARVSVHVEMSIEASSKDVAREIFSDQIAMSATLVDTPESAFDVSEDSIADIQTTSIEEE